MYVGGVGAVVHVARRRCCAVCGRCRRCGVLVAGGVGAVVGGVGAVVYQCSAVAVVYVRGAGVLVYVSSAGAVVYLAHSVCERCKCGGQSFLLVLSLC